jgi:Xaa-Pro aminopeptidase
MIDDKQLLQQKLDQATQILDEFGVDLWLTFVRETSLVPDPALDLIYGLSVTWQSAFLISRSGRHTAIAGYYDADNIRERGGYAEVIGYHQGMSEHLRAALDEYGPRSIAINYSLSDVSADGLTYGNYQLLREYLASTPYESRLVSAEQVIAALRGRKLPVEVERVRAAVAITEQVFDEMAAWVRPGMTQRQIADFVHGRIRELGLGYAWEAAGDPIVTCGPESAVGHAIPGDVKLERGHTLQVDLGVMLNGYCSDLQRIYYVLDEGETAPPADVQHAFDVVLGAIKAGEAVLRPGVPGWQVDAAARQAIVDAGFPEYMHALGHLLGRVAHDGATVLGPRWERYGDLVERPVEAGNIFTLEPHVEVPGRGVVSLEEDVLVLEDGVEYLSRPQLLLRTIG